MSNENIDIITLANRVANEKENIRQAIENRGVDIPETTPLNQYPAKIMAIDTENVATDVYFAGDQDESGPNMLFNGNYGTIAPGALEANQAIESVDFNYVSTVGDAAFEDCTNLTNFTGDHLKYIGNNAFSKTGLTSLDNSHIQYIGSGGFSECPSLTTVDTHNAKLGSSAFQDCSNMRSFTSNATTIPSSCCYRAVNMTSISLPNATKIGSDAFSGMGSTAFNSDNSVRYNVSLPSAVTIGSYAFYDNYGLQSFSAPNATHLGDWSLSYACRYLNSVDLSSVEYIGNNVFRVTDDNAQIPFAVSTGLDLPNCQFIGSYNFYWTTGMSYSDPYLHHLRVSDDGCKIGEYTFRYSLPRQTYGKVTSVGRDSYYGIRSTSASDPFIFPFETLREASRNTFKLYTYDTEWHVLNNSMDFSMATYIGEGQSYDYAVFGPNNTNSAPSNMYIEKIWLPNSCINFYTFLAGRNSSNPIHVYTDASAGKSTWTFCNYQSTDSRFTTGTSNPFVIIHYNCTHQDFEDGTYNV